MTIKVVIKIILTTCKLPFLYYKNVCNSQDFRKIETVKISKIPHLERFYKDTIYYHQFFKKKIVNNLLLYQT